MVEGVGVAQALVAKVIRRILQKTDKLLVAYLFLTISNTETPSYKKDTYAGYTERLVLKGCFLSQNFCLTVNFP